VLEGEGADGELTLLFVDEAAMADLNREHMGADGPTDVLAFPIDGRDAEPSGLLGDVVVCPAVARRRAPGAYEDELDLLVVHGVLHVLGMDHAEPEERAEMEARQQQYLAARHR
jgi:probable rRNA maturation factor